MKRFIRTSFLLVILTGSICTTAFAGSDYVVEKQPQVIEQVQQLEAKGVLKQKPNGYLYVEVSKEFIASVLPIIESKGKIVPPQHYTSKKGIGAHISVIYENELIENEIWEIGELGKEYSFTVKELRTIKLTTNNKLRKLWLLAVEAPELERLRQSYGLKPLLKGHDFHITIGTQVPGKSDEKIVAMELEEPVSFDAMDEDAA